MIYIEPHIAIGRMDDEPINKEELLDFVERFCEWLESEGYEHGGSWKLIDSIGCEITQSGLDITSERGEP